MIKKLFVIIIINFFFYNLALAEEKNQLILGDSNSKITIKVFSSLTCPHCANFHNKNFDNIKKEYINTGKVKFEHHAFPLDLAALNAEKVLRSITQSQEEKFNFLKILYQEQDEWAVGSDIIQINEKIKQIGKDFGLNYERMENFIKNEEIQDQILNERINAQKKYSISSTPTIYINKKKYEGKHEYEDVKKAIEKLL